VTLRLLPTNPGLALHLRPGLNDHIELQRLVVEDQPISGVVFDPVLATRQAELLDACRGRGIETVLDTRVMELALPGSADRAGLGRVPWAPIGRLPAAALTGDASDELIEQVVAYVGRNRLGAVLAPTHFISGVDDPAFAVDRRLTGELRVALDRQGLGSVAIYYPLAIPLAALRDGSVSLQLAHRLQAMDIDALWLRFHPFGSSEFGPVKLLTYITACQNLMSIRLPLLAERTGTIGLALAAFGAVGGIECGLTLGERFNISDLLRPPARGSNAFSPPARVYIPELGAFLSVEAATRFFENPLMRARYGCKDAGCCPKGWSSMLGEPKRHGSVRRIDEVRRLGETPPAERVDQYLETFLRPATDALVQAAKVEPSLDAARRRYEHARVALGALRKRSRPTEFALPPRGRRGPAAGKRQPRSL